MATIGRILPGKTDDEKWENAEKYFSEVIINAPKYDNFQIVDIIQTKLKNHANYKDINECEEEIEQILKTKGFAIQGDYGYTRKLSDIGRNIKSAGGYKNYLQQLKEKQHRKLPSIVILGDQNVVANSQSSFDKSFNGDLLAEKPMNQVSKQQKKNTIATLFKSCWAIVSKNQLISTIVATVIATLILKACKII